MISTHSNLIQLVKLPKNKVISYYEFGERKGKPILYMHGITSSRISGYSADIIAKKMGIRLIAIDRPGIGLSTASNLHTVVDWADDIFLFADALGIQKFSLIGHSGGGAYTMGCAVKIPERLMKVGIASSAVPLANAEVRQFLPSHYRLLKSITANVPWILSGLIAVLRFLFLNETDKVLEANMQILSSADRKILSDNTIKDILVESAMEACRQGSKGIAQDAYLLTRDWGFKPKDIKKNITLWHGTNDLTVPFSGAEYLRKSLPHCNFIRRENEGHLFLFSQWESILGNLI